MSSSKAYNPKEVEERIYNLWLKSGFFNPDNLPKRHKKPYTITLPPPNVTGSLHMGHALNAAIQDILIRWKRLKGFKTLWLPGTDHAGIATQTKVEKELKKEGKTRFDLGREKFLKRIWQWKEKYGDIILSQFKKIGCSLDWSRTRFTMDEGYQKAVGFAFGRYLEKGWIYQKERPVNWCPRCQTSLSDLEIEYEEKKGKIWFIRYPIKSGGSIAVATTRPETMLGDCAVAVNPNDKRYKNMVGKKAVLPLVEREIPIISDNLVDPNFGTGAVKVTPAHDFTDYKISLRHHLPLIKVIDEDARMTGRIPSSYQGLSTIEARKKIVGDLEKIGFLEKSEDYNISLPKCYRCSTTIEVIPSKQWFLKMGELAQAAKEEVKKKRIRFYPKRFEKTLLDWLENIEDWCVSRQIWWGHRLPVWQCQSNKGEYFVSLEKPEKCPVCGHCQPKQVEDVLDTWFSSALWPFATLGWPSLCRQNKKYCQPKKESDLEVFYPTDALSTARDIINLWVARMIFSGLEFMGKRPFRDVFIHPTVLTKEGKRMSKSLGTGIDPLELIEKYGADATRFGIVWQVRGGQDMRFGEDNIIMGRKFCNKIWNAARFVLKAQEAGQPEERKNPLKINKRNLSAADKKILKSLEKTARSVDKNLNNFQFGQAAERLYNFFWHDFCDRYIEASKPELKNKKSEARRVLLYVLSDSLKLLHPFLPFISEEIYQALPIRGKKKSLMVEEWPV